MFMVMDSHLKEKNSTKRWWQTGFMCNTQLEPEEGAMASLEAPYKHKQLSHKTKRRINTILQKKWEVFLQVVHRPNEKGLRARPKMCLLLSMLGVFIQVFTIRTVISPNPGWSVEMEWMHNHTSMHSGGKKHSDIKIRFRQSFYLQSLCLCTRVAHSTRGFFFFFFKMCTNFCGTSGNQICFLRSASFPRWIIKNITLGITDFNKMDIYIC